LVKEADTSVRHLIFFFVPGATFPRQVKVSRASKTVPGISTFQKQTLLTGSFAKQFRGKLAQEQ
jgi:hypothetical protein